MGPIVQEEVVIVGGGIAGLATALALKKIGVRSLVLERSDKLRAFGAALSLFPNAWLALDALGVSDKLTSCYFPFQREFNTNTKNGTVQEVVFTKKEETSIGFRTVHRSALLEALAGRRRSGDCRWWDCSHCLSFEKDRDSIFGAQEIRQASSHRCSTITLP